VSQSNGTASKHTERMRELQAKFRADRMEAKQLLQERHLRNIKESVAIGTDWITPWFDSLSRYTTDGWIPLGTPSARRFGTNFPFFENEQQHALLRDTSRVVVGTNNHAWGILRGFRSFVVGVGYTHKVTSKLQGEEKKTGERAARKVTAWLDAWSKRTRWYERQREAFWRNHRDGDALIRMFPDDGWMKLRWVWPEQMVCPPGENFQDWGFGVKTDQDDTETILKYYFAKLSNPAEGEQVDPDQILHLKVNVDTGIKRGLPSFSFATKDTLDAAARLTKNLGEGSAVRAAISYIRKH
jgi:hypothetical protein